MRAQGAPPNAKAVSEPSTLIEISDPDEVDVGQAEITPPSASGATLCR